MWFGGIGTYIKASSQTHLEAGDRANDARAHQRQRGAGQGGGRRRQSGRHATGPHRSVREAAGASTPTRWTIRAGVDTSDHEVNLKILLGGPVMRGELSEEQRNALLASHDRRCRRGMCWRTITTRPWRCRWREPRGSRRSGRPWPADRATWKRAASWTARWNSCPATRELKALANDGKGLTRPELRAAGLCQARSGCRGPGQHPAGRSFLCRACWPAISRQPRSQPFPEEPGRHRLKREIVSTVLINAIVNLAGPVFVLRTREVTGLGSADVARGFVLADGAFGLSALKARIDALDLQSGCRACRPSSMPKSPTSSAAPPAGSSAMCRQRRRIADTVALYRAGVEALRESYAMTGETRSASPN